MRHDDPRVHEGRNVPGDGRPGPSVAGWPGAVTAVAHPVESTTCVAMRFASQRDATSGWDAASVAGLPAQPNGNGSSMPARRRVGTHAARQHTRM